MASLISGIVWYARLALTRQRRGRAAAYLSVAAAAGLVWVSVGLRQLMNQSLAGRFGRGEFDAATMDIAILGVAISAVQSMLAFIRLTNERISEVLIFRVIGAPAGALIGARLCEIGIQCLVGGAVGAFAAFVAMAYFGGWSGSLREFLVATGSSLLVPLVAMFPIGGWAWIRISRVGRP